MPTRKPSPATLAARVLGSRGGSARTEAQTAARRANGAKGGRPVAVSAEVRYTVYGGVRYQVDQDGYVSRWYDPAGHYTLCHDLTHALAGRIRARARGPEGRTTDQE